MTLTLTITITPTLALTPHQAEAAIWKSKAQYELTLQRSGMPQPWGLVEKLADELLEELLHSGTQQAVSSRQ